MPAPQFAARLAHIQNSCQDTAVVLTKPSDIEYFTGLIQLVPTERETYLLISKEDALLLHSAFTQVDAVPHNIRTLVGLSPTQITQAVDSFCTKNHIDTIQIDQSALTVTENGSFTAAAVPTSSLDASVLHQSRSTKDSYELDCIQQAGILTDTIFSSVSKAVQVGVSEQEVAQKIKVACIECGGSEAFPTIVAFGDHTALPHHQPTDRKLTAETPILIDMGVRYQRYCADMTRTWWFGDKPTKQFLELERHVQAAYTAAVTRITDAGYHISVVTDGGGASAPPPKKPRTAENPLTYAAIDQAAREYLKSVGYQKEFCHTTGHGLGLDIHEYPSLSFRIRDTLQTPVALTIEPGLYIGNKVGYRYENTYIVE